MTAKIAQGILSFFIRLDRIIILISRLCKQSFGQVFNLKTVLRRQHMPCLKVSLEHMLKILE